MKKQITPEDFDEWFEDNSVEAIETMTELMKVQHQYALELTRLVLEHAKQEKITKETVFSIFKDAAQLMAAQMNMD